MNPVLTERDTRELVRPSAPGVPTSAENAFSKKKRERLSVNCELLLLPTSSLSLYGWKGNGNAISPTTDLG